MRRSVSDDHKMIVCVCVTEGRREGGRDGGREGRAESGGMAAKKLEPHTEMWGTSVYMCVSDDEMTS